MFGPTMCWLDIVERMIKIRISTIQYYKNLNQSDLQDVLILIFNQHFIQYLYNGKLFKLKKWHHKDIYNTIWKF